MLCKKRAPWLYKLEKNFIWDSQYRVPEDFVFRDTTRKVRLIIEESGRMTVIKGYSWNGCSPKFCILDILIGPPEGVIHKDTQKPKTYYASLVHDALYQFLPDTAPVSRRHADRFFLRLLKESNFAPRWIYWAAVRLFGGLMRFATKLKREWKGTRQGISELLPPDAESLPQERKG